MMCACTTAAVLSRCILPCRGCYMRSATTKPAHTHLEISKAFHFFKTVCCPLRCTLSAIPTVTASVSAAKKSLCHSKGRNAGHVKRYRLQDQSVIHTTLFRGVLNKYSALANVPFCFRYWPNASKSSERSDSSEALPYPGALVVLPEVSGGK